MNNSSTRARVRPRRRARRGRRNNQNKRQGTNVAVSPRENTFSPRYMPRLPNTIPSLYRVDLSYSTNFLIESAVNSYNWTYRLLSGLYDPDDGGSGNTRNYTGFNEISAMFNTYIVEYVRYEIEVINDDPEPAFFTCCPLTYDVSDTLTVDGSIIQNFAEAPFGRKIALGSSSGQDRNRVSGVLNMSTLAGDPRLYYGASEYRGYYNGNPSTPIYFFMGGFNDATPLKLNISLKFIAQVRFADRIIPTNSTTIPPAVFHSAIGRPNTHPRNDSNVSASKPIGRT